MKRLCFFTKYYIRKCLLSATCFLFYKNPYLQIILDFAKNKKIWYLFNYV